MGEKINDFANFTLIQFTNRHLSRQKRRNLQLLTTYANDRRYAGFRNYFDLDNRSYFGLEFAYATIPNELLPFDYAAFAAYPGTVEAVVTNLSTGRADYLEVPRRDDHHLLLQASCAIPLMFPVYHLYGAPYLDGGCADAIPWRHALDIGCDRLVVVLTRERDYHKKAKNMAPLLRPVFRQYPNFLDTMRRRAENYNESREQLFQLEREGRVLVIAPQSTRGFSRTEQDLDKIRALWQDGFFAGLAAADAVRALWADPECLSAPKDPGGRPT